jgi:phosphonate metabolism protein (transferase hexapeptide repeat family)
MHNRHKQPETPITKTLGQQPTIHPTALVIDSSLGEWTDIGPNTRITETEIGDYSYVEQSCDIIYAKIGRFCSIASHVRINPGNHPLNRASLHHFTYRSRQYGMAEDDNRFFDWRRASPVTLGHDVWIGHGAVILPGVSLGTGAAVGAGAVVSRDIPPFTIAAGVPARPIRERFPKAIQDALLRIRWWNWSHQKLASTLNDFRALNAAEFVEKYNR